MSTEGVVVKTWENRERSPWRGDRVEDPGLWCLGVVATLRKRKVFALCRGGVERERG